MGAIAVRILIVDSSKSRRAMIRKRLNTSHILVFEASTVIEAERTLEREDIDVACIGRSGPRSVGAVLCRKLQKSGSMSLPAFVLFILDPSVKGTGEAASRMEVDAVIAPEDSYASIGEKMSLLVEGKRSQPAVIKTGSAAETAIFCFHAGQLRQINSQAQTLTGYSLEELGAAEFWKIIHPDFVASVRQTCFGAGGPSSLPSGTELKIVRKDGIHRWVHCSMEALTVGEGKMHFVIMEDITDRRQSEAAFRQIAHRDHLLLNSLGEGIFGVDLLGRTTFLNPAAARMLGFEPEEVIGKSIHEIIHHTKPDGTPYPMAECRMCLAFSDGVIQHVIDEFYWRKNGTSFPIDYVSAPIVENGIIEGAVVVFSDRTKQRQMERAVRESEQRYRLLADNVRDVIWIMNDSLRITYVSPSIASLLGYSVDEALLLRMEDLLAPDSFRTAMNVLKNKLDRLVEGKADMIDSESLELVHFHKNGSRIWTEVKVTFLNDPLAKTRWTILGVTRDITRRKEAEHAMRRSEAHYRMLFDLSPDAIAVHSDGRIKLANTAALRMFGATSPADLVGKAVMDFVHPDSRAEVVERIRRQFADRLTVPVIEERFIRLDGSGIDVEVTAAPIEYENSLASMVIVRDISGRKQTENEIRMLAQAIRSSKEAVSITDLSNRILFVNDGFLRMYGYAESELVGKPIDIVRLPGDIVESVESILSRTIESGWQGELINRRHDGSQFVVSLSTSAVRDEQGKVFALVGVATDITDRKQAEEALRVSETKFRIVADNTYDWEFWQGADGQYFYISPSCERIAGHTAEEFVKDPCLMPRLVHPADRAVYDQHRFDATHTKEPAMVEFRIIASDGTVRWIDHVCQPVFDSSGNFVGTRGSNRDVTDQILKEKEYRTMLQTAIEGFWIVDSNGKILEVNESYCRLSGYSRAELLTMRADDLNAPGEKHFDAEHIRHIIDQGVYEFETRHRCNDGSLRDVDVSTTYLDIGAGRLYVFLRDITERKKAEETLQKLLRAIEHIDEVVFMTDINGAITYANPAFEKVYGYSRQETIGKTPRIIKGGTLDVEYYEKFWATLLSGKGVRGEIVNKAKDGRSVSIEGAAHPIINEQGNLVGFIAVQEDISKRKKAELEKRALETQLMQSQRLESIGRMAGGIAHDFNNILGMIQIAAELIDTSNAENADLAENAKMIIKAAERGASITQELLLFARSDRGELKPTGLSRLVIDLGKFLEQILPKAITIRVEVNVENDMIMGDSGHLHQVLMNLAVNARDAMPDGGTLSMTLSPVDAEKIQEIFPDIPSQPFIELRVSDTGMGVDEETLGRIFDPFFTTKQRGKGTGLGLSIVHGIVVNHSGFIRVVSSPGKGTTFMVYFPTVADTETTGSEKDDTSTYQGNEIVLYVEDEPTLRGAVSSALRDYGYEVWEKANGQEALTTYEENRDQISLVITDLDMPIMGGKELSHKIRSLKSGAKIIVLTGFLDHIAKTELQSQGIQDVLTKPFSLRNLAKMIRRVLADS